MRPSTDTPGADTADTAMDAEPPDSGAPPSIVGEWRNTASSYPGSNDIFVERLQFAADGMWSDRAVYQQSAIAFGPPFGSSCRAEIVATGTYALGLITMSGGTMNGIIAMTATTRIETVTGCDDPGRNHAAAPADLSTTYNGDLMFTLSGSTFTLPLGGPIQTFTNLPAVPNGGEVIAGGAWRNNATMTMDGTRALVERFLFAPNGTWTYRSVIVAPPTAPVNPGCRLETLMNEVYTLSNSMNAGTTWLGAAVMTTTAINVIQTECVDLSENEPVPMPLDAMMYGFNGPMSFNVMGTALTLTYASVATLYSRQ